MAGPRDFDLVLRDARLSASGALEPADVAIRAGVIERIGPRVDGGARGAVEVDCGGALLLPGFVDDHVHYREPGATWKEGYVTGSAASVRGGATTIGEIQNNRPLVETAEGWRAKVASVGPRSRARVLAYGCATRRNLATLRELAAAAPAVKLFMAGDAELEVSDDATLRTIFSEVAAAGGLLLLHAEHGPLVRAGLERHGDLAGDFWRARSIDAERVAVERAIELCAAHGTRIHFFHVSSGAACAAIRAAKQRRLPVSAAACAHYLMFTHEDVARRGAVLKCNPSIKGEEDRAALRAAVKDGTLDVIESDHAPHPRSEKEKSFREAPSGIPGADLFLPLWLELVDEGVLTLADLIERGAAGPSRVHRLADRGALRPGLAADLVLIEERPFTITESDFASKATLSPYLGLTLRRRPSKVWIAGRLVFDLSRSEDLVALERSAPPPLDDDRGPASSSRGGAPATPSGCC